jgi:hypothetical protein
LGFLTYRCISFIRELKIWLGMVPESSLIPKWLRRNGHETTTRSGDSKYPNIKEFNSGDRNCTYKCFVFVRLSSPGFVPSNTGSPPESLLSARSNQYSLESLPSDAGMEPLNLFEFIDLQAWNTMTNLFPPLIVAVKEKNHIILNLNA